MELVEAEVAPERPSPCCVQQAVLLATALEVESRRLSRAVASLGDHGQIIFWARLYTNYVNTVIFGSNYLYNQILVYIVAELFLLFIYYLTNFC